MAQDIDPTDGPEPTSRETATTASRSGFGLNSSFLESFGQPRDIAPAPTGLPSMGIGPRVRKSPFFEATRRWGAKAYSVYNHMYMPLYYESPEADFWHLVRTVTVWDVAVERQVQIAGPDAAAFVQYLIPRDLSKLKVGQARYVVLVDDAGGIVNDPVLLKLDEDRFWLSLADADVLLWAKAHANAGKWNVRVTEPDVSPLQIQGPKSTALMERVFGSWVSDLGFYKFRMTDLDGVPMLVARTGWSGERGYEIFLMDGKHGDALWERLFAAGEELGVKPAAPSTIRRIEAGFLSYGADITLDTNPFEVGLDKFITLDAGFDHIGKDALRQVAWDGPKRLLVGVEILGAPIAGNEHPWTACFGREGEPGVITSAVYSPRLDRNIALALAPVEASDVGRGVIVETPEGQRSGMIVPVPFHDPQKAIMKS